MSRTTELRDTLDDLLLSAEQVDELSNLYDLYALRDMLFRLHREIRDVRREMLILDADNLMRLARNFGGIA